MKYIKLFLGILLFAIGIVLTIQADLGIGPWDAFHQGISIHTNLSFGQAGILVGVILLFINLFLKQYIGIGTIVNIIGIGLLIDFFMASAYIQKSDSIVNGLIMLIIGMFVIALGSYFYIGAGFGAGPRDGLMVGLHLKLNKPVGMIRGSIEIITCFVGFLLGGKIGIGTVIIAFGIGPIVAFTFKILRFEVKDVKHRYFSFRKLSLNKS